MKQEMHVMYCLDDKASDSLWLEECIWTVMDFGYSTVQNYKTSREEYQLLNTYTTTS